MFTYFSPGDCLGSKDVDRLVKHFFLKKCLESKWFFGDDLGIFLQKIVRICWWFQYLGRLAQNWNKRANPQNRTMFGSYWSRKVWLVHLIISRSKYQGPLCVYTYILFIYTHSLIYIYIQTEFIVFVYRSLFRLIRCIGIYTCRYVLVSIHSFGRVISRKVICNSSDPALSGTGCIKDFMRLIGAYTVLLRFNVSCYSISMNGKITSLEMSRICLQDFCFVFKR